MTAYQAIHFFILVISIIWLCIGLYILPVLSPYNLSAFYILVYSASSLVGYWFGHRIE